MHLDPLTIFGLVAMTLMVIFYALEERGAIYVLLFAGTCVASGIYGYLQGAWPFTLLETVFTVVALHRWWKLIRA